jgi:hypothetical protein
VVTRVLIFAAIPGALIYFYIHPLSLRRKDASPPGDEALARARSTAGGLSTFEQMVIRKPRTTMDNASVVDLWKANVGANVILQMIRNSNGDFDVSANAIIELKKAGIDQSVILAMIDATYDAR